MTETDAVLHDRICFCNYLLGGKKHKEEKNVNKNGTKIWHLIEI